MRTWKDIIIWFEQDRYQILLWRQAGEKLEWIVRLRVARDRSNEVVESGDTKGINLISMKPFLLTIVGPFQASNPPPFQSWVCNKAFRFFQS